MLIHIKFQSIEPGLVGDVLERNVLCTSPDHLPVFLCLLPGHFLVLPHKIGSPCHACYIFHQKPCISCTVCDSGFFQCLSSLQKKFSMRLHNSPLLFHICVKRSYGLLPPVRSSHGHPGNFPEDMPSSQRLPPPPRWQPPPYPVWVLL